jgi:hypothetical protein
MWRHYSLRVPFSEAALHANLSRLENEWEASQASRDRNAIYGYLAAVFDLVAWWKAEGSERRNGARAQGLRGHRLLLQTPEPFAALIMSTSTADKKTRSKWSRVLRYASEYKDDAEALRDFIKRKGGINRCATRYARYVAREKSPLVTSRKARFLPPHGH